MTSHRDTWDGTSVLSSAPLGARHCTHYVLQFCCDFGFLPPPRTGQMGVTPGFISQSCYDGFKSLHGTALGIAPGTLTCEPA